MALTLVPIHRGTKADSVAGFLARSGLPKGAELPSHLNKDNSDSPNHNVLLTVAETASAFNGIPFYLMQSTIKSQTHFKNKN